MSRPWNATLCGALLIGALLTGCGGVGPGPVAGPEPETTGSEPQTTSPPDGTTGTTGSQPQTTGSEPQTTGSEPQTTGSEPQTTSPPDGTTATTGPETETSGAEPTDPTGTGQAVNTPKLPIGGDSDPSDEAEQCASASFLGQGENSIPSGVSIVVTGAVFGQGLFTQGGSACDDVAPGEPACLDGFVFTANDPGPCVVPVRTAVTRPTADDDTQDQLRLRGRLQCSAAQEAECRDLARRLDADDQYIDLYPPLAEPTETTTESTETTTEPTGTTTEPTETTTTETETSSSETTSSSGAGD